MSGSKCKSSSDIAGTTVLVFFFFFNYWGFPGGSEGKASTCDAGDPGLIRGSGRSPGEGTGNPLQYSCLENPMDRGAWWAAVHRLQSWIQLSNYTLLYCTFQGTIL